MPDASLADRRRDVEHATVRVLASARTLDDAAPEILEGICAALDFQVGLLWFVDAPSGKLRCASSWLRDATRDPGLGRFRGINIDSLLAPGEEIPGRVWEHGKPAWVRDIVEDVSSSRAPCAADAGLRGAFAFPITDRDEFFGVMEFFSSEIYEPDEDLLQLAESVGTQIGQFVDRVRLEERLALQNAILESQNEAAIDGIVAVGNDGSILYTNRRFAEMWGVPQHVVDSGDHDSVLTWKIPMLVDPTAFTDVVRDLDERQEESRRNEIELKDGRVFDRWTAPLRGPGEVTYGRAWYYRDVTDQKRLERRLRDNEQWLSFVADATSVLTRTLDYRTELNELASLAVPTLGDWCVIHVVEANGEITPVAAAHRDGELLDTVRQVQTRYPVEPNAPTGVAEVIRTGQPQLYENVSDDVLASLAHDAEHASWLRSLGFTSTMIVPLTCRGRVLGTITLVSAEDIDRYTRDDLRLVQDLASRVAFPIDNARLYEERVRVARTLQDNLLPPDLPEIPGVELAARYYPAGSGVDVGGDFYDVFPIGTRSWGVAVGDVSGKGVEAATVTSLARHTLRTAAMTTATPSEILTMLNAALYDQIADDRFCTAVYARVEPGFGRLRVTAACGGHPAPYVVRSNGTVERLACEGTVLGVVPDPSFADSTVDLTFGDKLIFYTDGVLDVRSDGKLFGPRHLEQLLRECAKRGAGASLDLVADTVLEFQGGTGRDDIALVALGVRASIFRLRRRARFTESTDLVGG